MSLAINSAQRNSPIVGTKSGQLRYVVGDLASEHSPTGIVDLPDARAELWELWNDEVTSESALDQMCGAVSDAVAERVLVEKEFAIQTEVTGGDGDVSVCR